MKTSSSLVAAMVSAAIVVALVGCSSSGTTTQSATTTAGPSTSPSTPPPATSPAPQPNTVTGTVSGIDVTITAQDPTTLRPGGAPMRYSVTLVNTTTTSVARVGIVVSLGHCSCGSPGSMMMAAGSMRMLDPDTKAWVTVPYVREGGGTDFLARTLVEPFVLEGGQETTYQLEVQLDANQDFTVGKGESAINVTMTDVTTNTAIGVSPTASLPIAVEP